MRSILILFIALTCSSSWAAEVAGMQERSQLIDRILEQRFTDVLPGLMRREKIDMWVIMSREYNEDPVIKTMLPAAWISARRHTMLVIYDPGAGKPLERLAVARYAVADLFSKAWDKEQEPDQWAALARVISERNPRRIAVNVSESFALADGMSSTEYRKFMEVLPAELRSRVIPAENLAIADEKLPKIDLKKEPEFVGRECPTCGEQLVYREGRYGRFIGCGTFPKCRFTEQILVKLGIPCPTDGGDIIEKKTKRGRVFYGCANYPDCDWTSWKRPLANAPCKVCQGLLVQVDKSTAECTHCGERQPLPEREAIPE